MTLDDIRTPYGSGGQSPPTSETNEDVPKLSSKTSLTPSDAHKVVIEVSDSDAENAKGNYSLRGLIIILYFNILQFYREISSQTAFNNRVSTRNVTYRITSWFIATIL